MSCRKIGGGSSSVAMSSLERTVPRRSTSAGERLSSGRVDAESASPPANPASTWACPFAWSNSTTVQRWQGTIRRTRPSTARPTSAGERAPRIA